MSVRINNLILKLVIFIIIIFPAVIVENMSEGRLNLFILLIIIYVLVNIIRILTSKNRLFDILFLLIEVLILLAFEMNSKYYVNYLFHSLYLLTMIDASMNLESKHAVIINVIALSSSIYKYIKLLRVSMNFNSLAEMLFFMILSILIVFSIILLKYYKIEKEKKEELIKELELTHDKLLISSKLDTELKLSKQRNSIARDIHDTLGHTMTASIMQMEVLELEIRSGSKSAVENAKSIKETLRLGLDQVRGVVEAFNSFDALDIEGLIKDFSNTSGFDVEFKIDIKTNDESLMQTLYRATQESLTNSIRHGKSTKATIEIIENKEGINFYYRDNGQVDPNWEVGFGLRSMRERFLDLNGYIEFSAKDGFIIDGFISWEELDD